MTPGLVNIHTHRPTGQGIELRTAGIHPWEAERRQVSELLPLPEWVQAIGETGLDFACDVNRERQVEVFRKQLALAHEHGLPVVLHCVRAFEAVMRELAACEPCTVIFHGFIGSPEQTRQALTKGYYLSFGERTFASPKTLAALRETPLSRLFLETDDSPVAIGEIYARAAEARGVSIDTLAQAVRENYERIVGKING